MVKTSIKLLTPLLALIFLLSLIPISTVNASPANLYFHYRNEGAVNFLGLTNVRRTLNNTAGNYAHYDPYTLSNSYSAASIAYRSNTGTNLLNSPKNRTWDGSVWSSSETEMSTAGSAVRWVRQAYCPLSARAGECIIVTVSDDGYLDAYVRLNNGTWFVTNNIGAVPKAYRCFDVAYEKTSGKGMLVYGVNSTNTAQDLAYKTWDGSSWSAEQYIDDTGHATDTQYYWVALASKPTSGANEITLVATDSTQSDANGFVWAGSSWGTIRSLNDTVAITTEECIAVAYESTSGKAWTAVGAGTTTAGSYWFRSQTGGTWNSTITRKIVGGTPNWCTLKADPASNNIMLVSVDGSTDLNIVYWSGSGAWTVNAGTFTEDTAVDTHASRCADFDWEPSGSVGIIVWGTATAALSAQKFTAATPAWSAITPSGTVAGTHPWVQLRLNPNWASGDIKILGAMLNSNFDLGALKWDGTTLTLIGDATFTADTVVSTFECFDMKFQAVKASSLVLDFYFYPELASAWATGATQINVYIYVKQSGTSQFTYTCEILERSSTGDTSWTSGTLANDQPGTSYSVKTISWTPAGARTFSAGNTIHIKLTLALNTGQYASSIYFAYDDGTNYNSYADIPAASPPVPVPEFFILGSLLSALTAFTVYLRKLPKKASEKIHRLRASIKSELPTKLTQATKAYYKLLIIAIFVFLAYYRAFTELWSEIIINDFVGYILVVPIVSAYLVYRKRAVLRALGQVGKGPTTSQELFGLALCLSAFAIYFYGTFSLFQLQLHMLSLVIFIAGCVTLFLGFEGLRILAFPLAYLFLMVPLPIDFIVQLAAASVALSAQISLLILKTIGLPVTMTRPEGAYAINLISQTGEPISFLIGLPCAGIYSILGYTAFGIFLAYTIKGTKLRKAALFTAGFLTVYLLNILRITTIIGLGYLYGRGPAIEAFHLFGGWVLTVIAAFAVIAYSQIKTPKIPLQAINKPVLSSIKKAESKRNRTIIKTTALMGIVLLFMFVSIPMIVAPRLEPAYVAMYSSDGGEALPLLPANFSGMRLKYVKPLTPAYASQNATHLYAYQYNTSGISINLVKVYVEMTSLLGGLHIVHGWRICMPITDGWKLNSLRGMILSDAPMVMGQVEVFSTPMEDIPVVLTATDHLFLEAGSTKGSFTVGLSLLGYTSDFVSAGIISNPADYSAVANLLVELGRAITQYWREIKLGSIPFAVTYSLYANIETLTVISAVLLAVGAILLATQADRKTRRLRGLQKYLSEEEKLTLLSLTTGALQRLKQEDKSMETLRKLESKGFIERRITVINDEPMILWKTKLSISVDEIKPKIRSRFDRLKIELRAITETKTQLTGLTLIGLSVVIYAVASLTNSLMWDVIGAFFLIGGGLPFSVNLERYISSEVAGASVLAPLLSLESLLTTLDVTGPSVYIPPTEELPEGRVFLPFAGTSSRNLKAPMPSEIGKDQIILPGRGATILPLGYSVLTEIEDKLKTSLDEVTLDHLLEVLPSLFTSELEIADEVKIRRDGEDLVNVTLKGSHFAYVCHNLAELRSSVCALVGCSICSSIALALAKASGRYVWIEGHGYGVRGDVIGLSFRLGEKVEGISPVKELTGKLAGIIEQEKLKGNIWKLRRRKRLIPGLALMIISLAAVVTTFIFHSLALEIAVVSAFTVGFLLLHLGIEIYVKAAVAGKAVVSPLDTMTQLFEKTGATSRGIYIPPNKNAETGKVFIPFENAKNQSPPRISELKEGQINLPDRGIVMTPIGSSLYGLIAQDLRLNERSIALKELFERLPSIYTEKLDLVGKMQIHQKGDIIQVEIEKSKLSYVCDTMAGRERSACDIVGCPLCSTIGITLAKVTGRYVSLHDHTYNPFEDKTTLLFKLGDKAE